MKKTIVESHFDEIAPEYDLYKKRNQRYFSTLVQGVQEQITKKNSYILDIGCGTGTMLQTLKPKKGLGVDISGEMIKRAKKKNIRNPQFKFRTHNIETKPILGNFDYILFTDVIEHLTSQEKAIMNIGRSMHRNTKFILSMANPFWETALMLLEYMHLKMPEGPHKRISENDLIKILNENKLHVLKKSVFFPKLSIPLVKDLGLIYVYTIIKID